MTKTFDPAKPVQIRDGRTARIVTARLEDTRYPIGAVLTNEDGTEQFGRYGSNGTFCGTGASTAQHGCDLVNIPTETVCYHTFGFGCPKDDWKNLVLGSLAEDTEADARRLCGSSWDGVLKLTTEDGKFVSAVVL